jgi:acetoin utilization deacetylase AcuC-like enzyme
MPIYYDPSCLEYEQPGHPESPYRVRSAHQLLTEEGYQFTTPQPCDEDSLLRAHHPDLIQAVVEGRFFDPDTPSLPGIYHHAILAAGGAVDAAHSAQESGRAFSLMRPPGHHASRRELGGFCYFNNIAVAVLDAVASGKKVAVVDVDCHHGNGTQDILKGVDQTVYVSLHQSPLYPGTGLASVENCRNYPLAPGTDETGYLEVLRRALVDVREFSPDLIGISIGFDTYRGDPLTHLRLEVESYGKIARALLELGCPIFAVLEGGYSSDFAQCVLSFIEVFLGGQASRE